MNTCMNADFLRCKIDSDLQFYNLLFGSKRQTDGTIKIYDGALNKSIRTM